MFKLFSVCFSSNLISITISDNSEMEGDNAIRQSIGDNLSSWSKKLNCNGDTEKKLAYKMKFIKELKKLQIAIETDAANQQHYEVILLTISQQPIKLSLRFWNHLFIMLMMEEVAWFNFSRQDDQ